jgi:membrane protease YdiL (CAAX protease family)
MGKAQATPKSRIKLSPENVSQTLILSLLLIRLLTGAVELITYPNAKGFLALGNAVYFIATYSLTAFLIWWERERLAEYHIGKLAVVIFILSKPYLLVLRMLGVESYSLIMTIIMVTVSLGLLWALYKDEPLILKKPANLSRWLVISLIIGAGLGIFSGYLLMLQGEEGLRQASLLRLLSNPTIQLANAAVYEEPLFRGFLWGYLRDKGWPDTWVWVVQAGLFGLAHMGYLGQVKLPISFWFAITMGFILGLIAWRARDIAPSMITHALTNGIGQIMAGI